MWINPDAEGNVSHSPIIGEDGNWMTWDETKNEYANTGLSARGTTPRLSAEQKQAIIDLATEYRNHNSDFIYDYDPHRNIYANKEGTYDAETGRVRSNCALFAQCIWGGIDPASFVGKNDTFDGSIIKAFDFGYYFDFPKRRAALVTKEDGSLYAFTKPHEDSYKDSFSWNTYYGESSTREDKQVFNAFMYAAHMAQELYIKGYEIPARDVEVGDLIFYRATSLTDNKSDAFQSVIFRNIGHVGVVHRVDRISEGHIGVIHCTDYAGKTFPFIYTNGWSESNFDKTYDAHLNQMIVMFARHPAAFGKAGNVPDRFTAI